MRVWITCECGQMTAVEAAEVEQGAACPACGQRLTPPPAPPKRLRLRGLAVASMVVGIVACVPCCSLGCWPVGIVVGLVAIGLGIPAVIGRTGGRGFGIAGVVMGIVGTLMAMLPLAFFGAVRGVSTFRSAPTTGPAVTVVDGEPKPPAPPTLTVDELVEALTGPLKRPADPAAAADDLAKALELFDRRKESPASLYECVEHFRLHLARKPAARPADPEHARKFATARDELVDAVLAKYRQAGEHQQDGKWREARAVYEELARALTESAGPLKRNLLAQAKYCRLRENLAVEEARPGAEDAPAEVEDD